jgi:hypothetical protein
MSLIEEKNIPITLYAALELRDELSINQLEGHVVLSLDFDQ